MNKLHKLVSSIMKDGKMSEDNVIKYLTSSIAEDEDMGCIYRELYEENYGNTITKELAEEWVKSMSVTDGSEMSNGQKWTMDQTTEVGMKNGADWSKYSKSDFYVVMNMIYSDNFRTAKKYGLQEDPNYFASSAKDWLCDEDAPEGSQKLFRYYFDVISK